MENSKLIQIPIPVESVNKLYNELSNILKGNKLTTINAISIVISLMKIVETYDNLKGEQKKQIILQVLTMFIEDSVHDDDELNELNSLIEILLPIIIDTVISIDKKEIQIKVKKCWKQLFACNK